MAGSMFGAGQFSVGAAQAALAGQITLTPVMATTATQTLPSGTTTFGPFPLPQGFNSGHMVAQLLNAVQASAIATHRLLCTFDTGETVDSGAVTGGFPQKIRLGPNAGTGALIPDVCGNYTNANTVTLQVILSAPTNCQVALGVF